VRTAELSVVPESFVCNANCPYCISRQNPDPTDKASVGLGALIRAIRFSRDCGAQTAIITGKGEPMIMNDTHVHNVVERLGRDFGRIDLHTNGVRIATGDRQAVTEYLETLQRDGLTNLTVSIASMYPGAHTKSLGLKTEILGSLARRLADYKKSHTIHIRWACILAKEFVSTPDQMEAYLRFAADWGADSVIFRELWVSDGTPQGKWCKDNFVSAEDFIEWRARYGLNHEIRPLLVHPWGKTYEVSVSGRKLEVSVGVCDFHNDDFVKSLILLPDNHLYYLWGSPAAKVW